MNCRIRARDVTISWSLEPILRTREESLNNGRAESLLMNVDRGGDPRGAFTREYTVIMRYGQIAPNRIYPVIRVNDLFVIETGCYAGEGKLEGSENQDESIVTNTWRRFFTFLCWIKHYFVKQIMNF